MAKKIPRLYRLSLLGIKKHVMADYDLNVFRTDLSGDSGIGKSITADMLQLIFIGKHEYRPATESSDDRPLKTLTIGRYGYAFINAEVQEGKYFVFGMFINGSTVDPFMIQQGYNWEAYTPLDEPFSCQSIMQGNIIPDIDELSETLRGKVFCQKMPLKKYHEYLMKYELLPVNVNTNQQLRSYAQTLRSFSRGRGFKYDSEYLKKFFFTEEKGKEINANFQKQLAEMDADLRDHERMNETLNELKEKEKLLTRLKKLKDRKTVAKETYYLARVVNSYRKMVQGNQRITQKKAEIRQHTDKIRFREGAVFILKKEELLKQIQETERKKKQLQIIEKHNKESEAIQNQYATWEKNTCERCGSLEDFKQQAASIKQVEQWIEKYATFEKIENAFTHDNHNREARKKLQETESLLRQNNIWEQFISSTWAKNVDDGILQTERKLRELDQQIAYQQSLMKLSDIDNSRSLSAWALKNAWKMTAEEESLLVHFSSLETISPEKWEARSKYVPQPEKLLKEASIPYRDQKGFWIDLGGIHEYVEYVTNRFFTTTDREELVTFFQKNHSLAQQEYNRLKAEKETVTQLQKQVNQIGLQTIALYNRKGDILSFENEPLFNYKSKDEFQQQLILHTTQAETIKHLEKQREQLEEVKNNYAETSKEHLFELKQIATSIGDKSEKPDIINLRQEMEALYTKQVTGLDEKAVQWKDYSFTPEEVNKISSISYLTEAQLVQEIAESATHLRYCENDIKQSEIILKQGTQTYNKTLIEYESLIEDTFQMQLQCYEGQYEYPEEKEKIAFITEEKNYLDQYNAIVEKYIPESAHVQFQNSGDFIRLSRSILRSDLVSRIMNDENKVLEEIASYLKEITEEYTRLGGRKLTMLKDLFEQVEETAINYMTTIYEVGDFFRKNNYQISQGIKLQIQPIYSEMYPLAWITEFLRKLSDHLDDLQVNTGLFAELIEEIDIAKMMKKAYYQCEGKAKNIQIEHLLDPLRYFDIDFHMVTEDGEENGGSSGQLYAAVSLLCIARLSLIERSAGNKENKGLRFMPIDEGESSGSNFYLLEKIARQNDYQIIVMSISPIDDYSESGRYQYFLSGTRNANGRICINAIFDEGKGIETLTTPADGE